MEKIISHPSVFHVPRNSAVSEEYYLTMNCFANHQLAFQRRLRSLICTGMNKKKLNAPLQRKRPQR